MITRTLHGRLLVSGIILAVVMLFGLGAQMAGNVLPVEEAYNTESLIRLHILANSDLPDDQDLKLQVRDAVIAETNALFAGITTRAQAWQQLSIHKDAVRIVAQDVVDRSGKGYPVEVKLGNYDFPEKTYGSLTVPAGEYQAMQVIIGQGKGKNWWCVLFPPLCFMEGLGTDSAIVRRDSIEQNDSGDQDQTQQQVVVEWRFKYLDSLYREYSQKLAVLVSSPWGRRLLSTAQLPSQVLLRH
ncbi:MAG: stage II sporulation protein R [Firmicutes bacterium]|nr:stage II sporulation protein R [Bacillota bacterium]